MIVSSEDENFEEADDEGHPQHDLRDRASLRMPQRYTVDVAEYVTPNSYEEATKREDAEKWRVAIEEELEARKENGTRSVVP